MSIHNPELFTVPSDTTLDAHKTPPCSSDPDAFFPPTYSQRIVGKIGRVCAKCPLREKCLELSLSLQSKDPNLTGIWAGTSPRQRDKILRSKRRRSA